MMWSIVTNRGNSPIIPILAMDLSQRSLSVIPSMGLLNTRVNGASRTMQQQQKGLSLLRSNVRPHHNNLLSPSSFRLSNTMQSRSFSQPPGGMNLGNIFNNANGQKAKPGETLAQYGIDLTALAKEGKLDPGQFLQ
jgi:ATP-dependent Clp protease ATP-binding subunit ClpA